MGGFWFQKALLQRSVKMLERYVFVRKSGYCDASKDQVCLTYIWRDSIMHSASLYEACSRSIRTHP